MEERLDTLEVAVYLLLSEKAVLAREIEQCIAQLASLDDKIDKLHMTLQSQVSYIHSSARGGRA